MPIKFNNGFKKNISQKVIFNQVYKKLNKLFKLIKIQLSQNQEILMKKYQINKFLLMSNHNLKSNKRKNKKKL